MKRKLFVVLLLLVIVALLSACGSWKAYDTGIAPTEAPAKLVSSVTDSAPESVVEIAESEPTETGGLDTLLAFLLELCDLIPAVAFGAPFIAFVIDLLKRLPKYSLPDGYAPLVSGLLNLALYAALFFFKDKQDAITGIVQALNTLAPFILMLFTSTLVTAGAHDKLANRGLGYSYTGEAVVGILRGG
jgi:hypothetical protein